MTLHLSENEIREATGYKLAPLQLAELKRQGFYRARRSPTTGRVILERAHFEAVAAGGAPEKSKPGPKLRLVTKAPA